MPSFSRYNKDGVRFDFNGIKSTKSIELLRNSINNGDVRIDNVIVLTQSERVEHIAGAIYGDARYWWVLAVASEIGWALQAPPGTIIKVPNLRDIERLFG